MEVSIPPYIPRNGVKVMNPAFFNPSADKLSKQAQAQQLMEEIYAVPFDSQILVADLLANENEELVPFMFYEAMRTGHALIAKAIKNCGKMSLMGAGPDQWEDSVSVYRRERTEEVMSLTNHDEMDEGVNKWLNEFDNDGDHLMYFAASGGHKHVINHLLEIGIPPTSPTKLYIVPLHAACFQGHLDCSQVLVARGLDINFKDDHGGTALMRAAVGGHLEIVRWLLANGADPQIRETREGEWNALELAAGRHAGVVQTLLECCAWSPTALMAAANHGNLDSFNMIAQAAGLPGPGSAAVDRKTWTELTDPQRKAILGSIEKGGSGGNAEILRLLLSFVPPEIMDDQDVVEILENSARGAASAKSAEAVKLLLDTLKETRLEDNAFRFIVDDLLIDAAAGDAMETTRLLLDSFKADVNFLEKDQKTSPLHHAVLKDRPQMIELLVKEYNANIHRGGGKFANGPSPLWYAVDHQFEESARALLACGGPVESIDDAITEETRKIYISADKKYRAPVRLRKDMDPAWDDDDSTERFLCLEYHDGWPGGVQLRRPDGELKDERDLRKVEDGGFVVV